MKRLFINTAGTLSALYALTATAAPYLYTFSGTIDYIEIDGAYYSDVDFDGDYTTTDDSFHVGDIIEYTFLVDFDLPGFCAGPLGTTYSSTCTGVDIPDGDTANYFFTDLVSATKLAPPTEENTTFNYGLSLANTGWLVADTAVFVVSPYNVPVEQWVATSDTNVGTLLTGTDAWAAPNGMSPYGRINSNLTLTSIIPVIVDEPDTDGKRHCQRQSKHYREDDVDHKGRHHHFGYNMDDSSHEKRGHSHEVMLGEKKGMKIFTDSHAGKARIEFEKRRFSK